jgi:triacylglycerol lipase
MLSKLRSIVGRARLWRVVAFGLASGALAGLGSCASRPQAEREDTEPRLDCATLYPLVLVHGIAGRDEGPVPYWGDIPKLLRARGARVFLTDIDGFAPIEDCASQLERRIDEVLSETGAAKVNIIAHSMGGLDARYYISSLGRGGLVASLTTLSTPHRGTAIADYFLEDLPIIKPGLARLVDAYSRGVLGDESPDLYLAVRQLSPSFCALFNAANPDDPRVRYQSWTSVLGEGCPEPLYSATRKILLPLEGENDGLVSVASARWGDFRGVVGAGKDLSISHDEIHDMGSSRRFDAPGFFASIVSELRVKGF